MHPFVRRTLLALVLPLMLFGLNPAQAEAAPAPPTASQVDGGQTAIDKAAYHALKRELDGADLDKSVRVDRGTRTITYTAANGTSTKLSFPASGRGSVTRSEAISVGGCGWFQVCVYLDRAEQRVAFSGSTAGVVAILCLAGPAACIASSVLAGAIIQYVVGERGGICPTSTPRLRANLTTGPFGNWQLRCVA